MTRRTMTRWIPTSILIPILAAVFPTPAAATPAGFEAALEHYEPIREALVADSLDGVSEHARALEDDARELYGSLTPAEAGVDPEDVGAIEELLPEIADEAGILAAAEDLQQARDAFYHLSMLLVRYHALADSGDTVVAFCPMKKRSWLQPVGEIGNPYSGKAMPGCGEIVSR